MKKQILLFVIVSFFFVLPSSSYAYYLSGNELLEDCLESMKILNSEKKNNPFKAGICMGYIEASYDMSDFITIAAHMNETICMEQGISTGQLVGIVVKYLKENPEKLHEQGASLVWMALTGAFPCNKQQPSK